MAKKRGYETVRDMVFTLAAVGVVVVLLLIFGRHSAQDPVKRIDYTLKFQQASQVAPYPLLAPQGLPQRWRATSADFDGVDVKATTWRVGFINPNEQYAAVEQTNGTPEPFIADRSKHGEPVGTVDVAGEQWQSYNGEKYRSLVRTKDGVTTVVTGTASYEDLATLAAALRTAPPLPGMEPIPTARPTV
ncbi:DUF4245 domain-containing protein [Yinghuangia seranimata]|uniref:DUF4245 domain-containing protein n=1 Tax=Yinghuangia seranimata TaxID=408067 RepID=UPI00248CE3C4|nr:DUF4245 domain-containing protein [Yinghuangia seranimata]MDI2128879.1 DUF4245 domain-containing protein [Yinghuangia seranimata]